MKSKNNEISKFLNFKYSFEFINKIINLSNVFFLYLNAFSQNEILNKNYLKIIIIHLKQSITNFLFFYFTII